jgi:uncharacterized membrane protein YhaH (DUF805 family)
MSFADAVKTGFTRFATFQGRASRSEFWYFMLFIFLGSAVLRTIDAITGLPVLGAIFALVTLIPNIAVSVRRLHDTDRSGWWYLLFLVPIVGVVVLLIWFCTKGTGADNRFGGSPLPQSAAAVAA